MPRYVFWHEFFDTGDVIPLGKSRGDRSAFKIDGSEYAEIGIYCEEKCKEAAAQIQRAPRKERMEARG